MPEERTIDPAARYLAAFRAARPDDARAKTSNREAIARRLAEGDLGPNTPQTERTSASRVAGFGMIVKSTALALGLGTGGVGVVYGGALAWRELQVITPTVALGDAAQEERLGSGSSKTGARPSPDSAPPRRDPDETHAPVAMHDERTTVHHAAPASPAPRPSTATPSKPTRRGSSTRTRSTEAAPRPTAEADALQAELTLMTAAEADLGAGRHGALLRRLDEHRRRFPRGALLEERRAWRAIALCALGRDEDPRAAAAFARTHVSPSLAAKVSDACGETIPSPDVSETDGATSPDEGT